MQNSLKPTTDFWTIAAVAAIVGSLIIAFGFALYGWSNFQTFQAHNLIQLATATTKDRAALLASQDTAEFTYALLCVAVVGSFVSVAGISVIGLTLRETQRATIATREIGQNQTRAYVHAQSCKVKRDNETAHIVLKVLNTGDTPALWVHIHHAVQDGDYGGSESWVLPEKLDYEESGYLAAGDNDELYLNTIDLETLAKYKETHPTDYLIVQGVIRYCDIYNQVFETAFAYHFDEANQTSDFDLYGAYGTRDGFRYLCDASDTKALSTKPVTRAKAPPTVSTKAPELSAQTEENPEKTQAKS